MTKTESTLICAELRRLDMELDTMKGNLHVLMQDIQGSASLYGRKSKIKGPKAANNEDKLHSARTAFGKEAASVSTD